jgi:alpha-1,6-mannosyltransferase
MRIVDVCAFYAPDGGGVRTYVEQKLAAGECAGHEIVILAPGRENATIPRGDRSRIVTVAGPRFPLDRRYGYFADEPALHRMLDRLAPDIVEASSPWTSASMVARWQGPARRVLVMHADPLSAYAYRWFGPVASRATIDRCFTWFWRHLRRLDDGFDIVVSASDSLTRRLSAGGLGKVATIPMGVEKGLFSPGLRDETLRAGLLARCGLGADASLLIGVGRHAPEKRWPMVIEAATAAGFDRPVGLMLVGDGRERARVVRAAGHNPHIRLVAPIRDRRAMAVLMASADALVHGCEAETFSMVAAEARASGLPIIVPDQGGASDHALQGQGLRYAACDAAAMADTIRRFIDEGPRIVRARSARAAAGVETMDGHFDRLFAAYRATTAALDDAA